jgi:hypothetical protein
MVKTIAGRMQMGVSKSANARLFCWMRQPNAEALGYCRVSLRKRKMLTR